MGIYSGRIRSVVGRALLRVDLGESHAFMASKRKLPFLTKLFTTEQCMGTRTCPSGTIGAEKTFKHQSRSGSETISVEIRKIRVEICGNRVSQTHLGAA